MGDILLKSREFAMHETCEYLPGRVNSCIYYARQASEIYQALPYAVNCKAPGEPWNLLRQYLVNVVLFWTKDLWTSELTVKLKSNLYVGPVNIFSNFFTLMTHCCCSHSIIKKIQEIITCITSRRYTLLLPTINLVTNEEGFSVPINRHRSFKSHMIIAMAILPMFRAIV